MNEQGKTSLFQTKTGMTPSLEDYLEVILFLHQSNGSVRVTDVADGLSVSKPSVNKAVKGLSELGFVRHEKYGQLYLTEEGEKKAENVASRHRAITRFLSECLGVNAEAAEEEACRLEHAMSFSTSELLVKFMNEYKPGGCLQCYER
ncbi:DtxR family transcriptional regulator [Clostridia bacterium]|nr:DtxR family transcriptional regulator [Clostridia bacterium]